MSGVQNAATSIGIADMGSLNSVVLPMWARERVYNTYGRLFGCSMDEVERPLKDYSNLGEFFTRRLKHGARPV